MPTISVFAAIDTAAARLMRTVPARNSRKL
jgi:hypothetical protein